MAGLFKHKLLSSKIADLQVPDLESKVQLLQNRYDAQKSGSLEKKTETECEQAFNDDVFKQVLGYTSYPSNPFTIDPKGRTQTSGQKPDAILGHYNPDETDSHKHTQVVVEIKDAKTPLDKSQKREGNLSPVQQGFKYKPQYQNCKRVIATNFIEIRLYKDTLIDFEIRTLEDLVDPSNDYENFKKFWWLLNADHLISKKGPSTTEALLSEVRIEQEKITKKFYKEYKQLRMELIQDLIKNNPDKDYNMLITKAQKIIDRLIFVHFCEDLGLLPEEKLAEVISYGDNMIGVSNWTILAGFFEAVNSGSDKLGIPKGYNGGLFHKDDELDHLKVGDDICKKFVEMGEYDFADDLSVNILGHIFEQSISDLEDLRAHFSEDEDKGTSKRKKDGIFYTPEYIVDYIVKNSLGVRLEERFDEIKKKVGLKGDITDKNYEKRELEAYGLYQQVLQNVKVLDPACGSGAFLVRVFDYLLAENERVGTKLGSLFDNQATYKSILQNNIYGVDLNEESVEITKLSLWLKTAEKGKKLADLDGNIKCGNSLIDDPSVAGEKAFDWSNEYKNIMESGGFDVVVGNPPYVDSESMVKSYKNERDFISNHYDSAKGNRDLFVIFVEHGFNILQSKGYISYILPNKLLGADYASTLRDKINAKGSITNLVDLSKDNIFVDASVYPIIFVINKSINTNSEIVVGNNTDGVDYFNHKLDRDNNNRSLYLNKGKDLVDSLLNLSKIKEEANYDIYSAATVSEAYELLDHIEEGKKGYKLVNTGTIDPWLFLRSSARFNYIKNVFYKPTVGYNIKSKERHKKSKIIIAGMSKKFECGFDQNGEYLAAKSTTVITSDDVKYLKYLLCYLHSALANYLFSNINSTNTMAGGYMNYNSNNIKNMPIKIPKDIKKYTLKADDMLALTYTYHETLQQTLDFLQSRYSLEKIPKKLQKFTELDFDSFKKILKLKKLSLEDEEELMSSFNKKHTALSDLQFQIDSLDKEIDEMVFDLYELTDEEREIVLVG